MSVNLRLHIGLWPIIAPLKIMDHKNVSDISLTMREVIFMALECDYKPLACWEKKSADGILKHFLNVLEKRVGSSCITNLSSVHLPMEYLH